MVMAMGRPLLGDTERGQEEHHHGEEKAIPGRAASADALLQLGDERVKLICANGERERGGGRKGVREGEVSTTVPFAVATFDLILAEC